MESALIFFYGSTNIFMEHLGHWGGKWRAQDFEHLSITVLFIGGGLVSTFHKEPPSVVGASRPRSGRTGPALNLLACLRTMTNSDHSAACSSNRPGYATS